MHTYTGDEFCYIITRKPDRKALVVWNVLNWTVLLFAPTLKGKSKKRFEVVSFPGSLLYFTSVQESLFAPTLKAKGVSEKRFEVVSFEQLIRGSNCTSSCPRPRVFLLVFLETNPCPTLYPTFVSRNN